MRNGCAACLRRKVSSNSAAESRGGHTSYDAGDKVVRARSQGVCVARTWCGGTVRAACSGGKTHCRGAGRRPTRPAELKGSDQLGVVRGRSGGVRRRRGQSVQERGRGGV
eukprot:scaffold29988_cov54-Phaeocystis_antarctica.AAC.1